MAKRVSRIAMQYLEHHDLPSHHHPPPDCRPGGQERTQHEPGARGDGAVAAQGAVAIQVNPYPQSPHRQRAARHEPRRSGPLDRRGGVGTGRRIPGRPAQPADGFHRGTAEGGAPRFILRNAIATREEACLPRCSKQPRCTLHIAGALQRARQHRHTVSQPRARTRQHPSHAFTRIEPNRSRLQSNAKPLQHPILLFASLIFTLEYPTHSYTPTRCVRSQYTTLQGTSRRGASTWPCRCSSRPSA